MRIFIHDEFDPETTAMLQALYSRSSESVETHAEMVRRRGSAKFMESYYVGYGHASIGDCGTTTLFFEGISILAAKAVQDTSLFSGQETSTRYIDFAKQPLIDPIGSAGSKAYLRRWIDYYESILPTVQEELRRRFPAAAGANERTWSKAIAARAFDIGRGFLPAASTTQTSWISSLRHAHEHLARLSHHPLAEVRALALAAREQLRQRYPSSFSHSTRPEEDQYLEASAAYETYLDPQSVGRIGAEFRCETDVDDGDLVRIAGPLLSTRPKRAQLPRALAELGTYRCSFLLDFGSFRDLQRHRNGVCRMPLLTDELGFHPWYIAQLPESRRSEAEQFVAAQLREFRALRDAHDLDRATAQYLLPIGMNVLCQLRYTLPQMVYVAELRSGQTVHPTLRAVAQHMAAALKREHAQLVLHADMSPSEFSVKRGEQDIVRRDAEEMA
jgi:thymidylate synthase ThyX